jgi:hypothetical protein
MMAVKKDILAFRKHPLSRELHKRRGGKGPIMKKNIKEFR